MAFLYAGVVSWPAVGVGFVGSMFGVWGLGVLFACLLRVEYPLSSRFTCFTLQASQRCAPPPPILEARARERSHAGFDVSVRFGQPLCV